jgi:hypothetical protein
VEAPRIVLLPVRAVPAGDVALAHLLAAIDLVARGAAVRVIITSIDGLDDVAGEALAAAQRAGVRFSLARDAGSVRAIVGPLEA